MPRVHRVHYLKPAKYWKIVHFAYDYGSDGEVVQDLIARAVGCSQPTVSRTLSRWERDGDPRPRSLRKATNHRLGPGKTAFLLALLRDDADLYLDEIQDRFQDQYAGRTPSKSTLCRALQDNGLTTKVLEHRAFERDAYKRWSYRETIRLLPNHERFVFLDEAHFDNRNVRRRRGRAHRGQPAVAMNRLGRQKSTSLLAAVTVDGMIHAACKAYEDGIDHDVLIEWATYCLLPNLPPACTLVLDNASIHHCDAFIALLDAAKDNPDCSLVDYLFLSPFSPDYNPIELCFAQIKRFVRRWQEDAVADIHACLARAVLEVTPTNARNYYRHVGLTLPDLPASQAAVSEGLQEEEEAALFAVGVAVAVAVLVN